MKSAKEVDFDNLNKKQKWVKQLEVKKAEAWKIARSA